MKKYFAWQDLISIGILGASLFLFFWPLLIGNQIYWHGGLIKTDFIPYHLAILELYHRALQNGSLPWWVNDIGSGYPLVASTGLGALYPVNLLFFRFLPTVTAINWILYLHTWWAVTGVYTVVVMFTKNRLSGIFSGFVFALSGYMVTQLTIVNIFMTISWFPWIFLLVWQLIQSPSKKKILILGGVTALQILCGYIALVYYEWLVLGLLGILIIGRNWRRQFTFLKNISLVLLISLGLSAIQLIPLSELTHLSTRNLGHTLEDATQFTYGVEGFLSFLGILSNTISDYYLKGTQLVTANEPQILMVRSPEMYNSYLGLLALLLLPLGILQIRKNKKLFALIIVTLFSILMMLGEATPVFSAVWHIVPGMKYMRYSIRFLGFTEFFLVIFAGIGFGMICNWLNRKMKVLSFLIAVVLICITFVDLFIHTHLLQQVTEINNWLTVPEMVKHLPRSMTDSRISSFGIDVLDWKEGNDLTIQAALRNLLPANFNIFFSVPTADIHAPLHLQNHAYLDRKSPTVPLSIGKYQQQELDDAPLVLTNDLFRFAAIQGVKYYISLIPLSDSKLKLLWQFPLPHEISLILRAGVSDQPGKLALLPLPITHGYLYELSNWVPRVKVFSHAKVVATDEAAQKAMQETTYDPQTQLIITGKTPTFNTSTDEETRLHLPSARADGGQDNAVIKEDNSTNLTITTSGSGGWLYLADTYYPGWHAYVDPSAGASTELSRTSSGQVETKIYRANIAFRAVQVPPGNHEVRFVYQPVSRTIGTIITLITVVTCLGFFVYEEITVLLAQRKSPAW